MSLPTAERVGSQVPRLALVPEQASTADADDALYLASRYGLTADDWQEFVLRAWMGTKSDGLWAAPRNGLVMPRQNGKNASLEIRELYGMLQLGERIVHTAHLVKTARKAMERLYWFFDNPRKFPKLAKEVKTIRKANGQEIIALHNGASIEFIARSRVSGLGFSADLMIFDEAQELTEEQLAALLPTVSASHNRQIIYTGLPPGPLADGGVFTRLRDTALSGTAGRLSWLEWGVEDVSADLDDPAVWAQANPGMGIRLSHDTILDERADMDDERFARERLGMWSARSSNRVISNDSWIAVADSALVDAGGEVGIGIDVNPDRTKCTISGASFDIRGLPYLDVLEGRTGSPDWAVAFVKGICDRNSARAVVVDAASPANTLVEPLRAAGITVSLTGPRQMGVACAMTYDKILGGELLHMNQTALNMAVAAARKRSIGTEGAWGWNRKSAESDITPLVAASLALWGLLSSEITTPKKPRTGKACFA